jgi:predicted TIM-barrel fold metal-dependent hydrolase
MIIDCHTHLGNNHHISFSAEQLLASMDKAKIDKSLVFAGRLNNLSNELLLKQIAPYKDRLYGVAAAHPTYFDSMSKIQDEAKSISDWYGEGKVVACKFYTGYDHFYPYDRLIEDYLIDFEEIGCPMIFHSGDCLCTANHAKLKYAHPLHIDDIAVDYSNAKFIIAHMGYPWHRDAAEVCYKNKNVFADISGFVYGDFSEKDKEYFKQVLTEFVSVAGGDDQLLFGTDAPISNQDSYVKTIIEQQIISTKIFEENPKKIFNL